MGDDHTAEYMQRPVTAGELMQATLLIYRAMTAEALARMEQGNADTTRSQAVADQLGAVGEFIKTLASAPANLNQQGDPEPKQYRCSVSGESFCQDAIARSEDHDPIDLVPDPTNRHDARAVIVRNSRTGEKLGFLPRDNWLKDAMLEQGKPVFARIGEIGEVAGNFAVVLDVSFDDVDWSRSGRR